MDLVVSVAFRAHRSAPLWSRDAKDDAMDATFASIVRGLARRTSKLSIVCVLSPPSTPRHRQFQVRGRPLAFVFVVRKYNNGRGHTQISVRPSVRSSVCLLTNDTSAQLLRPRHCAATGMQMRPRDRLRARGNYRSAPTEIRIGISVDTGFSIGRRARSTKSDDESGALFLVCP